MTMFETFEQRARRLERTEHKNEVKRKYAIKKMLERQEVEAYAEYYKDHAKGYCPKCRCIRALNGSCGC